MLYCASCKTDHPIQDFAWRNKQKGIRAGWCKRAQREYNKRYYAKNTTRLNKQNRRNYNTKHDEYRQTQKAYYEANKGKVLSKQHEYKDGQDPAVRRGYSKKYYERHRAECNRRCREWEKNNPDKHYQITTRKNAKRRQRLATMTGSHTLTEWRELLEQHDGKCADCGTASNITRDHIVPLSRGGTDNIENIQPLCGSCNSRKGARVS